MFCKVFGRKFGKESEKISLESVYETLTACSPYQHTLITVVFLFYI